MAKEQNTHKKTTESKKVVQAQDMATGETTAVQLSELSQRLDSTADLNGQNISDLQNTYGNRFIQQLSQATQPVDPKPQKIQRVEGDGSKAEGTAVSNDLSQRIQRQQGGGQQLPDDVRGSMESSFDTDFEDVRVHTSGEANQLSRSLGAAAFTTDNDIFFREGHYNPQSQDGQKLIAHELTHVVQQRGASGPQRKSMTVNEPDDQYEKEADSVAEQVTTNSENAPTPTAEAPTAEQVSSTINKPEEDPANLVNEGLEDPVAANDTAEEKLKEQEQQPQEEQLADEDVTEEDKKRKKTEAKQTAKDGKREAQDKAKTAGEDDAKKEEEKKAEKLKNGEKPKKEDKKGPKEGKLGEVKTPGAEALNGELSQEMLFDPELAMADLEEPDMPPLLPTWDELAEGTIQLSPLEGVQEELTVREQITGEENEGFKDISTGSAFGISGDAPEAASTEAPEQEKSGEDMANDALKEGALEGFKAGATDFVKDQAIQLATAKIPYADGLISFVQLATDPKKWMEDNVFAVGNSAVAMVDSFGSIGDETTGWGKVAAVLESLIALIDFINSIVSLINTIFTMVLFAAKIIQIFSNFMIALAPVGTPPPIFPFAWTPGVFTPIATFMGSVISFLHPINEVLSAIGNVLINIKFMLQPLAIFFRYMDMREFKGDPEELEKKQAKLKGNVSGFVSTATTKTANNAKDKAVDGVKKRHDQKRAKNEIEGLETQQAANRARNTDDPDLDAKVAAKKEKFASEFGENYSEYTARRGKGQMVKKGLADAFGVRTHTDPVTGKVKMGRTYDDAGNDITGSGVAGKKKKFDSDAGVVGAFKKTGQNIINPLGLSRDPDKNALNLKKVYREGQADIQKEMAEDPAKYRALSQKLGGDRDSGTIIDPAKRQKYETAQQRRDAGFDRQEDNATTRRADAEKVARDDTVNQADNLRQQERGQETILRNDADDARGRATQRDEDASRLEQRAQTKQANEQSLRQDAATASQDAQTERSRVAIIDNDLDSRTQRVQQYEQDTRRAESDLSQKQSRLKDAQEENKQLALAYYKKDSKVTKEDVDASQRRLQEAHDNVKRAQEDVAQKQQKARTEKEEIQRLEAERGRALVTARQKDAVARRKGELADRRAREAADATQQAQQARQDADDARQEAVRKEAGAERAKNSAERQERELFEARKNKYKEEDWDYNQTTRGKVINWFTTVDPTGGQRHGPGALGKNLIGWVEGYKEFSEGEEAYATDRAAADKAQGHYGAREYAAAWNLVKGLDASKWQSTADEASSEDDIAITYYQTKEDYQKLANDITTLQTALQKVFGHGNVVGPKNNISLAITAEFDNDTSYRSLKSGSMPFVAKVMSADGEELLSRAITTIPLDGTAEEVDFYSYLTVTQGKFYLSLTPHDVRLVLDGRDGNGDGNYFEEVYKPSGQLVENTTADDGAQHSDITVRYTRQSIHQGPKFQTAAGLPAATAGSAYTADITADDPDGDNGQIDFMLDQGGDRPNWLSLTKNGNGTATLTGTPPAGTSGTQTVTVWIFDKDGLLHSRQFTIEVTAVAPADAGTAQTKLIQRQATDEDENLDQKSDAELEQDIQAGESLTAELATPVSTEAVGAEQTNDPIDIELEAEEQAEAEQSEEVDEDAPSLSDLITAARMTQMIDELPEPPENAIDTIQQNSLAYAHLTGEEYDLYLERQQVGQLQEHAQGQQIELEGTQAINEMNKKGVNKQIADAEVQHETQEDMKQASANQQEGAEQTSEQGGLFDGLFSDIFGAIMEGFGLGSAVGVGNSADAGAVNSGAQETSKTTEDTNQLVKNSPAHMEDRQNRTKKVATDAQQSRAELEGLDNVLDQRQQENEEGMDVLNEVEETNLDDQDAVAEEKERLQDEHLETLDEAVMWADEHQMVREDIFSQLEDDLSNDPADQEETLEQISF